MNKHLLLILLGFGLVTFVEGNTAKDCANEHKGDTEALISCINSLPSDEETKTKEDRIRQSLELVRAQRIAEEKRQESCYSIQLTDEREKCLEPRYISNEVVKIGPQKTKPVEKKETSWLGQFASAFIEGIAEGVIEAGVNEALDLDCEEDVEVRSRTTENIPGSPQYGSKTRTTIKQKKCP